ncbi:hypothetical protein [Pseudarthrobacter sp. IC2-21]|uniref:hypothetical protein n=1 Tax=Pseudarthrobacter sp. IC2-21 TaxID=3092262 RepID=UPI002A69F441|nr:hypothetical protein [Pseudarthrobacter sp. IC2-21]
MTAWNSLSVQEYGDVRALIEEVANTRGTHPRNVWRELHKILSSAPELAHLPEEDISARVIVVARRTLSEWPVAKQVASAAISRVCHEHGLERKSVVLRGVHPDGNGSHRVEIESTDRIFTLTYEQLDGFLRLKQFSYTPLAPRDKPIRGH